jgi:hypothetical protein
MPNPLVAAGGGSILAGASASRDARKASNAQVAAGDRAALLEQQSADKQLALQREIWEKQQADYKPYLEQGTYGINRLGDLMKQGSGQLNNPLDKYLESKELDVRKAEAKAGQAIATSGGADVPPPKSNTGLYVGLAIGGLAVVGLVVYLVTKKK